MIPKGVYRHFKGKLYMVTDVAIHTETLDAYVVYHALDEPSVSYVRPAKMWNDVINGKKRFEPVAVEVEV